MLVTNYDGRLEQMALHCEAMLDNLAKVNNAYQDVSNNAYSVSLPADMIKFKGIKKVGGETIVWNQMVDSGTTTVSTISGHKYYTLIDGTASIVTADGTAITIVDDTADMVCDLTLMFGTGSEPSTTADFTAIFGATHYSYNAGELLSAGVTEVVSKDGNNATLHTIPIPAEIQALEGYGWSAGTAYNYVDFERKVFVKRVDRVNLGTLTWTKDVGGLSNTYGSTAISNIQLPADEYAVPNIVIEKKYISGSFRSVRILHIDKNACVSYSGIFSKCVFVYDTDAYADGNAFKTALNNVYMYYELATPVETDISEYLTDDKLIQAASGGTLTFPNSNGDDYRLPVPSEIEYIGVT